jgi:hypothetical protein
MQIRTSVVKKDFAGIPTAIKTIPNMQRLMKITNKMNQKFQGFSSIVFELVSEAACSLRVV